MKLQFQVAACASIILRRYLLPCLVFRWTFLSTAVMPSKIDGKKVGFVGAGAMAEALARGFVDKKVIESSDIWCCDPSKSRMDVFTEFGANAVKDGPEVRSSYIAVHATVDLSRFLTCNLVLT